MDSLNANGQSLVKEITLATKFYNQSKNNTHKLRKSSSVLAFAYERARNAVEYRDEHLIRQAAIERILKRRLFLNQSSDKIASLLIKELTWARYIEPQSNDLIQKDKFKVIIEKYRSAKELVGLCACEIDELINFNPINQIIINYVSNTLLSVIDFEEEDKVTKSIQIYIATERSFAKNSEVLIKYRLLKIFKDINEVDRYLDYKHKDLLRRKVNQLISPFNLIRDLVVENSNNLLELTSNQEKLKNKLTEILEQKYHQTKNKVMRASKRSIIYIFLTKMILAILIEIPFDILMGKINFVVLSINVLFPPSLMILFNSRVKLPSEDNTTLMTKSIIEYLYSDIRSLKKEFVTLDQEKSTINKVFNIVYITTSAFILFGIVYLLNLLSFNLINQVIFLFFLSVVSFFAFRVNEISNDYLLPESKNDSIIDSLLDYISLPIIKSGQWLSNQIAKVNVLSFIFDFIIEAPLKTFIEILEQWLHFVRVKKEEFLG